MRQPRQAALFDEPEIKPGSVVEALAQRKPETKDQAAFGRLVRDIERKRAQLLQWQAYGDRFAARLRNEVEPAEEAYWLARRKLAFVFDEILLQPNLLRGKVQRAKLVQLLTDLAQGLLVERADAELEALHDRHSDASHADRQAQAVSATESMLESMFGVELDPEAKSLDELFASAESEMRSRLEQEAQSREENKRRRGGRAGEEKRKASEQAAKEASQSVREVYRKLASALHPDREPDLELRQQKTEQMQRVNQAYQAGDLLALLNLQLEIEQIDAAHLSGLPAQRLKHYVRVLREQAEELDLEIGNCILHYRQMFEFAHFGKLTPEAVDRSLSAEVAQIKRDVAEVEADCISFKNPEQLKRFLRGYQPEPDPTEAIADFMSLEAFFEADEPPRRAPRRRRK
jgi:hypothetical protein